MIQDLYKRKRSLELKWEQEHLDNNRYTLEMVRIDDKVKQVITEIKLEEAAIAHRQNSVEGAAPQVSVATLYKSYIAEIALLLRALLHSTKNYYINNSLYNLKRYVDAYSRRPRDCLLYTSDAADE